MPHNLTFLQARLVLVVVAWGLLSNIACTRGAAHVDAREVARSPIRDVRVRLFSDESRIRFRSDVSTRVFDRQGGLSQTLKPNRWWSVSVDAKGDIQIGDNLTDLHQVLVASSDRQPISISLSNGGDWGDARRYRGAIRLEVTENGTLRGVNEVDVEEYIACVVGWEAWPTFRMAALRAQAIAARTYALDQMIRHNELNHDMAATQGDQVYKGIRNDAAGKRARQATNQTRGVVCTWGEGDKERMFPAYYSAACGGLTQSAAIFGPENDIPPLRGGVKCNYCRIAPKATYRWGPVRIRLEEVRSRLRSRYPKLSSIRKMEVSQTTPAGRPVTIRLTDANNVSYEIQAERMRYALGPSRIRSTDFKLRIEGSTALFSDGRGFGHGLGLCQWGAEGLARKGKQAAEILQFYYPGSNLSRAY